MNAALGQRLAGALVASLCLHTLAVLWLNPPVAKGLGTQWKFSARLAAALAASPLIAASPAPVADTPPAQPPPAPGAPPPPASASIAAPLIAFSPPVPDVYLPAGALDVRAVPLNDVMLVYPERAFRAGISGKVVLTVLINEHGGVDDVFVAWADPPGYFEHVAEQAARDTLFAPAMKSGRAVKSRKLIEVEFSPSDPGADGP